MQIDFGDELAGVFFGAAARRQDAEAAELVLADPARQRDDLLQKPGVRHRQPCSSSSRMKIRASGEKVRRYWRISRMMMLMMLAIGTPIIIPSTP